MRIKLISLVLGLLALIATQVPAGALGPTFNTISYGPSPQQVVDVRYPATDSAHAVLFIHGGCWESGSRQVWDAKAQELANEGWITWNMDYRLGTSKPYLDIPWDVAHVVAQMKQDPQIQSVSIVADSAGGHLALNYGLKAPGNIHTIATLSAVTDPIAWQSSNPGVSDCFERFTKSTYSQNPSRWHSLSPMWMKQNGYTLPRTYIYGSRADNITAASTQLDAFYNTVMQTQPIWGAAINQCQTTYSDHGTRLIPCAWAGVKAFLPQP